MNLTIITACTRPENLAAICASFGDTPVLWIIVIDRADVSIALVRDIMKCNKIHRVHVIRYEGEPVSRAGGQHAKNFGIEFVQREYAQTAPRYVYFLDDDNLLHPDFMSRLEPIMESSEAPDLIVFGQNLDLGAGMWLRKVCIQVYRIDQAQYVVRFASIGAERIPEDYAGDGMFIVALNNGKRTLRIIDEPLCWYNRLYKE